MSLWDDYKDDVWIEEQVQRMENRQRAKDKLWIKNGKPIAVKDMSDKYIQNCINWIENNDETDFFIDHLNMFKKELKKRMKKQKYTTQFKQFKILDI